MPTTLLASYFLLLTFFAVRRFEWAVMFLIAALPSYLIRFKVFDVPFTLLEAMTLIVFFAWLLKNYRFIFSNLKSKINSECSGQKSKIINRYPFDIEIILLLIISFFAVGIAGFSQSALGIWKAYFFEPILLYIVLLNIILNKNVISVVDEESSENEIRNPPSSRAQAEGKSEIRNKFENLKSKIENVILWPFLVSALAVSALAIFQKITGHLIGNPLWAAEETRRVVSFFGYPNAVGLYLGPLILLFVGWFFNIIANERNKSSNYSKILNFKFLILKSPPWRDPALNKNNKVAGQFSISQFLKIILLASAIILSLLVIIFAKSVGALFGVVAGLFVFGLLAGKKSRWATLAIALIASAAIISWQPARQLTYKYITLNDFSGQVRIIQWNETWNMLKNGRLIMGAGLANYQSAVAPYHQEGFFYNRGNDPDFHKKTVFNAAYREKYWQPLEIYLYPHNIFLNFWTELGLAGMLLFIWIIVKFYYLGVKLLFENRKSKIENYSFQKDKYITLGLLGAITSIIIHGLVDVPYFKNDLSIMFWILLAMIGILNSEKNNS